MIASNAQSATAPPDHDPAMPCGSVLVCGAGIAGIQASLDLSAAGFHVYLVEQSPTIGGTMARLDKTFPTGDCATCTISPKLVACMRDFNIDILTMADVLALDGQAGHFKAKVRLRPRGVDPDKCTGCGDCIEACPVRNRIRTVEPPEPSAPLDEAAEATLRESLARHQGDRGALMPVLQDISRGCGYLPRPMVERAAIALGIPLAAAMRVASFYEEFRFEPPARHLVEVCNGTSCHAGGSARLLRRVEDVLGIGAGQADKAGRFALRTVRCLGLCALSPVMRIDGVGIGQMSLARVPDVLESCT